MPAASSAKGLILRTLRLGAIAALLISGPALMAASCDGDSATDKSVPTSVTQPVARPIQATYTIEAGVNGEIFPAFANFASLQRPNDRNTGTISVEISNPTAELVRQRLIVQVPGWSDPEIQTIEVGAGESKKFLFAPSFLPRFYSNTEIAAATALVTATDMSGKLASEYTVPVRLRSVDDMYWGDGFKFGRYIASWVTPHDPDVEELLARAKEFVPGRRLPGYEPWKTPVEQEQSTTEQAKAIYRALQEKGLSYVKSSITFGARTDVSERIRMPHESLRSVSANCIDGVVMYASMFENLAMDPVIILIPGHALVGVRLTERNNKYLYIDTVLTGRDSFESAVRAANDALARYAPLQVTRISVSEARDAGVFPMPNPAVATNVALQATTQAQR